MQDLQESEGCQDELALRVQQLKAELVLFKGLMSNVSRVHVSVTLVAINCLQAVIYGKHSKLVYGFINDSLHKKFLKVINGFSVIRIISPKDK